MEGDKDSHEGFSLEVFVVEVIISSLATWLIISVAIEVFMCNDDDDGDDCDAVVLRGRAMEVNGAGNIKEKEDVD